MCGILAAITPHGAPPCRWVPEGIGLLNHRGPDTSGSATVLLPKAGVSVNLAMCRLTIVDQTPIVVPYRFPYLGITLAFNGEIYNWKKLRTELADGRPWMTDCDAEVIARAWARWGPQCQQRFNGMWGFVLVDEQTSTVFVSRDRAGKKPLFYAVRGSRLYISSEIKALPCALEEAACHDLEAFEFDHSEEVPIQGIRRLLGGHQLSIRSRSEATKPDPTRWWVLPVDASRAASAYDSTTEALTELIVDAVRLRTLSEVPVALQLSGGLDSAILLHAWARTDPASAASAQKYCMDFAEDGIDNLSAARLIDPSVLPVRLAATDIKSLLPKVAYHLDTPATWSALCLWQLAEAAHHDGNRIVLSGEGADELFGGYSRYRILYWLDRMRTDPHLFGYEPTIKHLLGSRSSVIARLLDRSPHGRLLSHTTWLARRHDAPGLSAMRACMSTEFCTTMQVLLRMGDRMASAWSLENRCPFLDHRIVELAWTLPDAWLVTEHESKHILRDVARRLDVPTGIVDEQTKKGLAIPWAKWAKTLVPSEANLGSRGAWERAGFASLMRSAWIASCLRCARCSDCD